MSFRIDSKVIGKPCLKIPRKNKQRSGGEGDWGMGTEWFGEGLGGETTSGILIK